MNWKSSLTGAVLVAAAGLAVGAGIGGKTNTSSDKTITVARTISVTVTTTTPAASTPTTTPVSTTPGGSSATSTGTTSTGTTSTGTAATPEYYATYLSTQNTGSHASNAQLDGNAARLELKGNTYPNAVAFDLDPNNGNTTESYQLPIPGFATFTSPIAGLQTSDSAGASYTLKVYKNNDNPRATVLYSNTFTGPSGTHPIKFSTLGATDLLFVWTNIPNEPDDQDEFIMADPLVTS